MNEASEPCRIGIYGGTFDPPHLGHLALARLVRDRFGLSEVLIVPAPEPPHKHKAPVASFAERCAMLELALASEPDRGRLTCSRVEEELPRPSYTIHTVRAVMAREAGRACRFFLIVGMDSLEMLPRWHDAASLLALVDLIVVNRDRFGPDAVLACIRGLRPEYVPDAGETWRNPAGRTLAVIADFDMPLSSTALRRALAQGDSPPGLPAAVLAYIRAHGLYT